MDNIPTGKILIITVPPTQSSRMITGKSTQKHLKTEVFQVVKCLVNGLCVTQTSSLHGLNPGMQLYILV